MCHQPPFSALGLAALISFAVTIGCGDSTDSTGNGDDQSCLAGQLCTCITTLDCPSGEVCSGTFCRAPESDGNDPDVEDEPDALPPEDASADVEDEPEITEDAAPEVADETQSDPDVVPEIDVEDGGDDLDSMDTDEAEAGDPVADEIADIVEDDYNPWVAFTSTGGGKSMVHFIRADGTGLASLDSGALHEIDPAWAPGGRQLAVVSYDSATDRSLIIFDFERVAQTSIDTTLTNVGRPSWSADGTHLAVQGHTSETDDTSIYVIDLRTETFGELQEVTTAVDGDTSPLFSTDDVFFIREDGDELDIFHSPRAGGTAVRVTDGAQVVGTMSMWAANDSLVFVGDPEQLSGDPVPALLDLGDSETTPYAISDYRDFSFFRDGSKVAGVTDSLDSDSEIAVVDAVDGTLILQLTNDAVENAVPSVSSIDSEGIDPTNY